MYLGVNVEGLEAYVDAIDLPGIIDNRDVQLAHKTLFFYLLIFVTLGSHILHRMAAICHSGYRLR